MNRAYRQGDEESRRNAAMLLSTTGAAVAGAGFGTLFAWILLPVGWAILLIGLVAHIVGMVETRRAQRTGGYRMAQWETTAYWLCWLTIAALFAYLAIDQFWPELARLGRWLSVTSSAAA